MMPNQYYRSGGVSPVPSPLRSTYLGGGDASSVEPGGAPLGVRITSLGLALAVVLGVVVFCLAVWGTLWLLGMGYFITALTGVCVAFIAVTIAPSFRKK